MNSSTETLTIDGDVGFETGNLQFKGVVVVKGNVRQSFFVKATGNVTVRGDVDFGASVMAAGNVMIGGGIIGRRTQVVAGGMARVGFVEEATVRAGLDLVISQSAVRAVLRAGGTLKVLQVSNEAEPEHAEKDAPSSHHLGRIAGGEVWSRGSIEAYFAGDVTGQTTELNAGMDPEFAKKLEIFNRKLEESNKHISRLLSRFNVKKIDIPQIKRLLSATTGSQRKVLARAAHQLGQAVQIRQKIMASKQELEDAMSLGGGEVYVRIWEQVFPGVTVRMGEFLRRIDSEIKSPKYHVEGNQILER